MTGGEEEAVRLVADVTGRVQGVGFRWAVRERATALGLTGSATNRSDGSVRVVVEGPRAACERLLAALRPPTGGEGPALPGRVATVEARWEAPTGGRGFAVG